MTKFEKFIKRHTEQELMFYRGNGFTGVALRPKGPSMDTPQDEQTRRKGIIG